jgi:hypothetical protein
MIEEHVLATIANGEVFTELLNIVRASGVVSKAELRYNTPGRFHFSQL